MRRSIPRFLAAIFFSWLLAIPVLADLTGDVQGTVTDASGARVADAKITIKNLGTGATRTVTTGSGGEFSVPQLEIGEHLVTVEKDGFKAFAQHVIVRSGEKIRVDVVMQLGNVTESVEVESSATPTLGCQRAIERLHKRAGSLGATESSPRPCDLCHALSGNRASHKR